MSREWEARSRSITATYNTFEKLDELRKVLGRAVEAVSLARIELTACGSSAALALDHDIDTPAARERVRLGASGFLKAMANLDDELAAIDSLFGHVASYADALVAAATVPNEASS